MGKPEFNYDPATYRWGNFDRYVWGATWYALKKAWRAYRGAAFGDPKYEKNNPDTMLKYARRIRWLEYELGKQCTEFPHLDLYGQETERPKDEEDDWFNLPVSLFPASKNESEEENGDEEDEGIL